MFIENETEKKYFSKDFNYTFNKINGVTKVWGKTFDDDPDVAPFNMILDFEITEVCEGIGNYGPCKFCYKSNTANKGYVTPFELAKKVIDRLPRECTQIAFGTDAKLKSNKEWFGIFKYARKSGFIPNVTVADLDKETAKKVASVVGAAAVSRYHDKDICYNTIKNLTDFGLEQCNMHVLLSKETMPIVYETINDITSDKRLDKLNAVVFLSLKKKGRGESFNCISQNEFAEIIRLCNEKKIRYGFDSCSAHKFLNTIKGTDKEFMSIYVEPCESTRMSFYINSHGEGFPCSFTEGTFGWENGVDVANCNDFVNDVWNNDRIKVFRETLIKNKNHCPIYNI